MDGKIRRQKIIEELKQAENPLSGSCLAAKMGVSRQVIVQDIALLRSKYSILATPQGYLFYKAAGKEYFRSFLVKHTEEQIYDELASIVSLGGQVMDVCVEHDFYGQLRAELNLTSLTDVIQFCEQLKNSSCGPLFPISAGVHLHTVKASSKEILDQIEEKLKEKGYLLN